MSFRSPFVVATLLVAIAGCGNYSNEDLEFMNALPEKSDLTADVPMRSAVTLASTAELYRTTREVAAIFNGITDAFLNLIDGIRAFPPTTRKPDERIWGPVPAANQPGWLVRMIMQRQPEVATFSYSLDFIPAGAPDSAAISLITGSFAAAGGVRKGSGEIHVTTDMLRAAGGDPGLGYLETLDVLYDTSAPPISVDLTFVNLPDPLKPLDPTTGHYVYSAQENGQGALSYEFSANSIPGPAGLDTFNVTSRWLGTGEGRSDLQVVSGDAVGALEAQCWNSQLQAVYIDKPWAPLEDIGAPADCPAIPTL
jgi:hypothetical protein